MSYSKLSVNDKTEIVRLASTTSLTNTAIASQFNVSPRRIGQIVNNHSDVVAEVTHDVMYDAVKNSTGHKILDRTWRLQQYERDLNKLDSQWTSDAVNSRTRILAEVAKEIGDIAPSQHNITAEVSHIIGIDMDQFKSPVELMTTQSGNELTGSQLREISGDIITAEIVDEA